MYFGESTNDISELPKYLRELADVIDTLPEPTYLRRPPSLSYEKDFETGKRVYRLVMRWIPNVPDDVRLLGERPESAILCGFGLGPPAQK